MHFPDMVTFPATPPPNNSPKRAADGEVAPQNRRKSTSSGSGSKTKTEVAPKASRQRSCEGCKLRKMRCSRTANCAACTMRGERCVWLNSQPQEVSPPGDMLLAQAEISRLRGMVELLSAKLEERGPPHPPMIQTHGYQMMSPTGMPGPMFAMPAAPAPIFDDQSNRFQTTFTPTSESRTSLDQTSGTPSSPNPNSGLPAVVDTHARDVNDKRAVEALLSFANSPISPDVPPSDSAPKHSNTPPDKDPMVVDTEKEAKSAESNTKMTSVENPRNPEEAQRASSSPKSKNTSPEVPHRSAEQKTPQSIPFAYPVHHGPTVSLSPIASLSGYAPLPIDGQQHHPGMPPHLSLQIPSPTIYYQFPPGGGGGGTPHELSPNSAAAWSYAARFDAAVQWFDARRKAEMMQQGGMFEVHQPSPVFGSPITGFPVQPVPHVFTQPSAVAEAASSEAPEEGKGVGLDVVAEAAKKIWENGRDPSMGDSGTEDAGSKKDDQEGEEVDVDELMQDD
ncbi:hypothetical protein T439DRAFT_356111 [Meredithblackwellia eburnea MCA 4105]